jgi:hypothetical protein
MGGQIDMAVAVADVVETVVNTPNLRLIDDVELIHHNRDDVFPSD